MRNVIQRREVFELLATVRLLTVEPSVVAEFLEDWQQDPQAPEHALPLALADYYEGVRNGYLSDIYEALTGKRVEVVGKIGGLHACPCCLHRTLTERYDVAEGTGYDVCRHCGWEDDGTSDSDASSGINSGSMEEYRARLEKEANFFNKSRWFSDQRL